MQPRIHDRDDGRMLNVYGSTVLEKAGSADLSGGAAVYLQTLAPAGGPPPHKHRGADAFFFVVEGELDLWLGERFVRLTPGMSATVPRGTVHRFVNRRDVPARVLTVIAPGEAGRYFDAMDAAAPVDDGLSGIAAIIARHALGVAG